MKENMHAPIPDIQTTQGMQTYTYQYQGINPRYASGPKERKMWSPHGAFSLNEVSQIPHFNEYK